MGREEHGNAWFALADRTASAEQDWF
jgi:hypothetical protein